jgi:hypothetical protein
MLTAIRRASSFVSSFGRHSGRSSKGTTLANLDE